VYALNYGKYIIDGRDMEESVLMSVRFRELKQEVLQGFASEQM